LRMVFFLMSVSWIAVALFVAKWYVATAMRMAGVTMSRVSMSIPVYRLQMTAGEYFVPRSNWTLWEVMSLVASQTAQMALPSRCHSALHWVHSQGTYLSSMSSISSSFHPGLCGPGGFLPDWAGPAAWGCGGSPA
jgi:hypothetical protein